jgi:hypothetical protein
MASKKSAPHKIAIVAHSRESHFSLSGEPIAHCSCSLAAMTLVIGFRKP